MSKPLDILVISTYFWPELNGSAPFVTGPAEYLAAQGHRVTVVSGYPHYPAWEPPSNRPLGRTDVHEGVVIRRRWHYVPARQSAVRRAGYEATLVAAHL